jgi:hypothetical protein
MLVERKSLLDVQAAVRGKAPNCSFHFTCAMLRRNCAMRFGRVVRVLLSPHCLDLHGLIRPNRDFSMSYTESNKKILFYLRLCMKRLKRFFLSRSSYRRGASLLNPSNRKIYSIDSVFPQEKSRLLSVADDMSGLGSARSVR